MDAPPPNLEPSEFARPERIGDLTPYLKTLIRGKSLSFDDSQRAFEQIMSGMAHPAEMGALLALLGRRIPTVDELAGAATVMRARALHLESSIDPSEILDTAGTGGAPKSFNVSTLAAITAASQGAFVAKHGNRSRTGRGSSEVLEALGVKVDASLAAQRRCLEHAHVAFCHAPAHHPAARHAIDVRKTLGFPTIFNLLGPLTNPARARRQAIGVYDRAFVGLVANVLAQLGAVRAVVYHSMDGLDEFSTGAATLVAQVQRDASGATVRIHDVTPEALGVDRGDPFSIAPLDLGGAATLFRSVLENRAPSTARDMVLINSAAALLAAGRVTELCEGVEMARVALTSGAALATLERLKQMSNEQAN